MGRNADPNSKSALYKADLERRKAAGETVKRGRPPAGEGPPTPKKQAKTTVIAFQARIRTNNGDDLLPMSREHLTANSWQASEEEIAQWYATGEIPIATP